MKNILNETPLSFADLSGRQRFTCQWVANQYPYSVNVLNIGCGFGWFERFFSEHCLCSKIVCTELSPTDVARVKKDLCDSTVLGVSADAVSLPFSNSAFDLVCCWEVIEHLPPNTEVLFLKEVRRVLNDGGTFLFSTPYASVAAIFFDPAWWLIGHRHYSKCNLLRLCRESDLIVKDLFVKGSWWDLVGTLNMYFSKWVFRRDKLFADLFSFKQTEEYLADEGFMTTFIVASKDP